MLMRAMKKEHLPERDWVKIFNSMLNVELSFVEHGPVFLMAMMAEKICPMDLPLG